MQGKSILITGCSSGIGLDAALILKQRGYRVFASARKEDDVKKLKAQGLESVQLDVNDSTSIKKAVDEILALTNGKLDALFNNAGYVQPGAIEDLSCEAIRAQFDTNVFGPMELIRLILPVMRKQGSGRIVQNSSILGVITLPFYGAYNASKFALEGFSDTLRQELRGTSIHVSVINPGPIVTKIRDNAHRSFQKAGIDTTRSAYHDTYKKMEQSYFNADRKKDKLAQGTEAVVKQLIHALESPHPKAHYYIGRTAKLMAFLKRILPDSGLDWVLSKAN